jgi:hypothetical protein
MPFKIPAGENRDCANIALQPASCGPTSACLRIAEVITMFDYHEPLAIRGC